MSNPMNEIHDSVVVGGSSIVTNKIGRFDDELINTYFSDKAKEDVEAYVTKRVLAALAEENRLLMAKAAYKDDIYTIRSYYFARRIEEINKEIANAERAVSNGK